MSSNWWRLGMFAWGFALQSARNGVRVKQLHYAVRRTVFKPQLPTSPTTESFLQVFHRLPPLAEGPGHLNHGGVQSQKHRHGHDKHGVEDD